MALSIADGYVSHIRRQLDEKGFSNVTIFAELFKLDGRFGVVFPDNGPELGTPEQVLTCIRNAEAGNVASLQLQFENLDQGDRETV